MAALSQEAEREASLQFVVGAHIEVKVHPDFPSEDEGGYDGYICVGNTGTWRQARVLQHWYREAHWCPDFAVPYLVHILGTQEPRPVMHDDYRCIRAIAGAPPDGSQLPLDPRMASIPYVVPTLHDAASRQAMETEWLGKVRHRVSSSRGATTDGCRGGDAARKAGRALLASSGTVAMVYNDNPPRGPGPDDDDDDDVVVWPEKYLLLFTPAPAEAVPTFEDGRWRQAAMALETADDPEGSKCLARNKYHNRFYEQHERQKEQGRAVVVAEFDYRSGEAGASVAVTITVSTPQTLMPKKGASRSGEPRMGPSCHRRFVVFARSSSDDDENDDDGDGDGDDDEEDTGSRAEEGDDNDGEDPLRRPAGRSPLAIVRGLVPVALDLAFEKTPQVKSLLRRCAEEEGSCPRAELHLYDTSPVLSPHPASATDDMAATCMLYAAAAFARSRGMTLRYRGERLADGDTADAAEGARAATRAACRRLRDAGRLPPGHIVLDDDDDDDDDEWDDFKASPNYRLNIDWGVRRMPLETDEPEAFEVKVAGRYRSPAIEWDRVASMRNDANGGLIIYHEHMLMPEFQLWRMGLPTTPAATTTTATGETTASAAASE